MSSGRRRVRFFKFIFSSISRSTATKFNLRHWLWQLPANCSGVKAVLQQQEARARTRPWWNDVWKVLTQVVLKMFCFPSLHTRDTHFPMNTSSTPIASFLKFLLNTYNPRTAYFLRISNAPIDTNLSLQKILQSHGICLDQFNSDCIKFIWRLFILLHKITKYKICHWLTSAISQKSHGHVCCTIANSATYHNEIHTSRWQLIPALSAFTSSFQYTVLRCQFQIISGDKSQPLHDAIYILLSRLYYATPSHGGN